MCVIFNYTKCKLIAINKNHYIMKQLSILFAFLFLFTSLFVGAQNEDDINPADFEKESATLFRPARVFESDESMSQGIQNAIVVELISKDEVNLS